VLRPSPLKPKARWEVGSSQGIRGQENVELWIDAQQAWTCRRWEGRYISKEADGTEEAKDVASVYMKVKNVRLGRARSEYKVTRVDTAGSERAVQVRSSSRAFNIPLDRAYTSTPGLGKIPRWPHPHGRYVHDYREG
jgi:hypothetical protein